MQSVYMLAFVCDTFFASAAFRGLTVGIPSIVPVLMINSGIYLAEVEKQLSSKLNNKNPAIW